MELVQERVSLRIVSHPPLRRIRLIESYIFVLPGTRQRFITTVEPRS